MGEESREAEALAAIKARLERRARRLEGELRHLRELLGFVDARLAEVSFKPAAEAVPAGPPALARPALPPPPPLSECKQLVPVKSATGALLANLYITDDVVRVVPVASVSFDVNTPPFQTFLVNRILEGMAAKDREEVDAGRIPPERAFAYRVEQDGSALREVVIWYFGDGRRLQELKSSVRWTLARMHEKAAATPG